MRSFDIHDAKLWVLRLVSLGVAILFDANLFYLYILYERIWQKSSCWSLPGMLFDAQILIMRPLWYMKFWQQGCSSCKKRWFPLVLRCCSAPLSCGKFWHVIFHFVRLWMFDKSDFHCVKTLVSLGFSGFCDSSTPIKVLWEILTNVIFIL